MWYPLWDAGLKLGHAVRTFDDQLSLAGEDLDTATSLLSTRYLAGDEELAARLAPRGWPVGGATVAAGSTPCGPRCSSAGPRRATSPTCSSRTSRTGTAACATCRRCGGPPTPTCSCAPTTWRCSTPATAPSSTPGSPCTGRPGGRVTCCGWRTRTPWSRAIGVERRDALMAGVAAAARSIGWIAEGAWRHLSPPPGRARGARRRRPRRRRPRGRADAAGRPDGRSRARPAGRPRRRRARHPGLARAPSTASPPRSIRRRGGDRWPDERARPSSSRCCARAIGPSTCSSRSTSAGSSCGCCPEWEPVRSKPQRNAYHRFTVDRHLWEAAANAAELADRVERPDLLVLGALLHDIGKGYPGDHTEAGMMLVRQIAPRLGLDAGRRRHPRGDGRAPPAAARRRHPARPHRPGHDRRRWPRRSATCRLLELLAALTEADSMATGPSAWGTWKARARRRTRRPGPARARRWRAAPRSTWPHVPRPGDAGAHGPGSVRRAHGDDRSGDEDGTSGSPSCATDGPAPSPASPACCRCTASTCSTRGPTPTSGRPMAASQFRVVPPRRGIEVGGR